MISMKSQRPPSAVIQTAQLVIPTEVEGSLLADPAP